jgi:hypothetical protein
MPNIVNYRDFVFKVSPKLNSEFHRDYEYALNKHSIFKKRHKNSGAEMDSTKRHMLAALETKLQKTKIRMQKEKLFNTSTIKEFEGTL